MKIDIKSILLIILVIIYTACSTSQDNGANPEDLDGDGLSNLREEELGTDPRLADTDGDGVDDLSEYNDPGFSPLIAELPRIETWISTEPSLNINIEYTDETAAQNINESVSGLTTESSKSSSSSTEHTRAHSETVKASMEYNSMGGVSGKVEAEASFSESTTSIRSNSWSKSAVESNQSKVENVQTTSMDKSYQDSSIAVHFKIKNIGKRSVNLSNLGISVKLGDVSKPNVLPQSVTTLYPLANQSLENINIPVNTIKEYEATKADLPASQMLRILEDPRDLIFEIGSNYDFEDPKGNINYSDVAENVAARTSFITIDYGNGTIDNFSVATGSRRDENGVPEGMTISEIFQLINDVYTSNPGEILFETEEISSGSYAGKSFLASITRDSTEFTYELDEGSGRFTKKWFWTSSAANTNTISDFSELRLYPQDVLRLIYIVNSDEDSLIDLQEARYGTDPNKEDTDGDGIYDDEEVIPGEDGQITDPLDPENTESIGGSVTLYSAPGNFAVVTTDDADLSDNDIGGDGVKNIAITGDIGVLLFENGFDAFGRAVYLDTDTISCPFTLYNRDDKTVEHAINFTHTEDLANLNFQYKASAIKFFTKEEIETDSDDDCLPDAVEEYLSDTWGFGNYSPTKKDADEDGLPDWLELLYGTNPEETYTDYDSIPAEDLSVPDRFKSSCFLPVEFPNGVYFFSDSHYKGRFEWYTTINDTHLDGDNAIGNNNIESVYIKGNYIVWLYKEYMHDFFGGAVILEESTATMPSGFSNTVSSIKITMDND